jgi:formamidopyrimidine-DNA glycosylase
MPELPDVEGFKRVLAKNALRKTIDRVVVSDARILGKLSARTFASRLQGAKLIAVRRHGKHLMANVDRGGWLTLHFGMTGALDPGAIAAFAAHVGKRPDDQLASFHLKRLLNGETGTRIAID